MTIIKPLSLNALEKQSFKEKIQEKVTSQFNLAADFGKLQANEIYYSVLNEGKVAKMESTIGKQFTIPVKTHEGLDGEVYYTEVNGAYLYNVATKTTDDKLLADLRKLANSNEEFNKLSKHITKDGYTLNNDEEYVIQNTKYLEDTEGKVLSDSLNMFSLPLYQKENLVGILSIDESNMKPVILIGNERIFVHENGEIVTIQADSCSLSWAACMNKQLGCSTWNSCLIIYGSCLGACCTCLNPLSCIVCAVCAVAVVGAAWTCRMCVPGAARPKECPK
ncbi:hypothetical protein [Peribacillus frigoritolerans]|uniref:hypothetical protein n=1 Tax=Peribacillus frigoritolerans TaxID=450367 RepID=UPI00227EB44C|nr:hypothetical protein [Peribacillus frigoritolerans]MCY9002852.1 hypothetical protein [Peribacillus frigoritolerans]